jgi:hypothetical protein
MSRMEVLDGETAAMLASLSYGLKSRRRNRPVAA